MILENNIAAQKSRSKFRKVIFEQTERCRKAWLEKAAEARAKHDYATAHFCERCAEAQRHI